jgi:hypothetical protein
VEPHHHVVVRLPFCDLADHGDEPGEVVVEREFGRHAVRPRVLLVEELVHERVDVVALGEHPVVGVEPVHLFRAPLHPLPEPAGEDPVEREERADHRVGRDR